MLSSFFVSDKFLFSINVFKKTKLIIIELKRIESKGITTVFFLGIHSIKNASSFGCVFIQYFFNIEV